MNSVINLLKRLWHKVQVNCFYNPYTVENYWRKQGLRIGTGNRIHTKDFGTEPYLIKIGNNCGFSSGIRFITHDGATTIFRKDIPDLHVFGSIEIKDNCMIGMNAILMPNIVIGPDAIVGAGAVVWKDVPPNTVVSGNPARFICKLEDYKKISIEKFSRLGLKGPKTAWRKQLEDYFWNQPEHVESAPETVLAEK